MSETIPKFSKLDKTLARRIVTAVGALHADPRPSGARPLGYPHLWRIRVSDYRVIYTIKEAELVVRLLAHGLAPLRAGSVEAGSSGTPAAGRS